LAEAKHGQFFRIDRIALQTLIEKFLQLRSGGDYRPDVRWAALAHRIPGIANCTGTDTAFQETLRANHEKFSVAEIRRKAKEIESIGASAVEGENRRVRSDAAGLINSVD
jgi:hypothetical protein